MLQRYSIIKKWLKSNEKVHYFGVCIKMRNNIKFREKVFALYDKPDAVLFKHMGEENAKKNVYLIYCNSSTRGFFSLFNLVLDGLKFADYYNLMPVVEFGNSTLYHEENGIGGVRNSFEYYFQQPSGITVSSARKSKNVVLYEGNHRKLSIPNFNLTLGLSLKESKKIEEYLQERGEIIRAYIRFSDDIKEYLECTVIPLIKGAKVLGVHVRGTDMRFGYNGHAKFIAAEEYLEATRKAYYNEGFEKIFLATDESSIIEVFEKEFGNKLVYFTDTLRSTDGQALHFSENERKHHKYLLGREVLRDMYALSISDGLIAGFSNVSLAARMMKKSYRKEYEYIYILSHGFNENNFFMNLK